MMEALDEFNKQLDSSIAEIVKEKQKRTRIVGNFEIKPSSA